ncbi:MAG: hypothetical protein GX343_01640 [Erysipelotrichaceae bacterium]|jgi:hypothetical protein|nr:hypothetical protein [Bacillota bacterium]NLJ32523.1 hypothetical protein [Erysipelotrichaceae bacterium]
MNQNIKEQTINSVNRAIRCFKAMIAIIVTIAVLTIIQAIIEVIAITEFTEESSPLWGVPYFILVLLLLSAMVVIVIIYIINYIIAYAGSFRLKRKEVMVLMSIGFKLKLVGLVSLFIARNRLQE